MRTDTVQLVVDRDLCIGAGQCVLSAPELFDQNDDDGQVVLRPDAGPVPTERIRTAVYLCPSGALTLAEDQHASTSATADQGDS